MLKQDVCKRGNQKPICLERNAIPYFPSTRRWAMSYSPNQKPQAQGPLPWFKCFSSSASCFALLYLLRLPEQSTACEFRMRISLQNKLLTCRDLSCWHLPQPWHNTQPGQEDPHTPPRATGINRAPKETQIHLYLSISRKGKKSSCFGYFFVKLAFAIEGPNCFLALPHKDLNATTEVFW